MATLTSPDGTHHFTTRNQTVGERPDLVVAESFLENVYRIHHENFQDTGILIDIGANIGVVTVHALTLGAKHVLAVEPEPHNLQYLDTNLTGNNVHNQVTVVAAAVSDTPGTGWISDEYTHSSLVRRTSGTTKTRVFSLKTLYDYNNITACDVLKIDVEGGEYAIIAGADQETLTRAAYITLEFDAADDATFGAMVTKLAKDFHIEILGSPERGGYIYAHRYPKCTWA